MLPRLTHLFGSRRKSVSSSEPSRAVEPRTGLENADSQNDGIAAYGISNLRVFDADAGIPQGSIITMAFDRDGYLWIGTEDGAARYNGRTWTVVPMPRRTASNFVRAVFPSPDGSVWFGTHGAGLNRLTDDEWETYDTATGLPDDIVLGVLEGERRDGARPLWVGTRRGLYERRGTRVSVFDSRSGLPHDIVLSLLESESHDGRHELWVGTRGGLARRREGRWSTIDIGSAVGADAIITLCESTARDGSRLIWAGTRRGGVARFDGYTWSVINRDCGLPDDHVFSIRPSHDARDIGAVWVGTGGGVVRLDERGEVVDTVGELPQRVILSLCVTPAAFGAESVWIGTDGGGLVRKGPDRWKAYVATSTLRNDTVTSFAETQTADGVPEFWIGSEGGLLRYSRDEWSVETDGSKPFEWVQCLWGDGRTGGPSLLVGTTGEGLVAFGGSARTRITNDDGLPSNNVQYVGRSTTGDDSVWVCTDAGVAHFVSGTWTHYTVESGLPHHLAFCLVETTDRQGKQSVWVGTNGGGLARLRHGAWTVYNIASGFPTNTVLSLCEVVGAGGTRTLWVGTQSAGVILIDLDDATRPLARLSDESNPALPNNTINHIATDDRGRVYLFTNKGVGRLTPRRATRDDRAPFHLYTFTTEDGLPSNECNVGAAYVDVRGRIWAGTIAGAAMLDPNVEIEDHIAKPLHISRMLSGPKRRGLDRGGVLSHNQNNLAFEYDLLSYFREQDTRYRTQLVGFDDEPSEWTQEWKRTYTNLPPGRYTFTVWGRDYAGNVSGPETCSFSIKPAPWRTWWAYAGYAGIAAGAAYGGVQWRLHTLRRRTEVLEETVARQTSELAAKVDQLRRSESITREKADELALVVEQLQIAERNAQRAKSEAIAAKDKALEASHAKSVFLSSMSHELRTPLNAVLGFAQLMDRDSGLSRDQREHLTAIMSSGEHLLHLINDVLSLSKIEAGKLTLTVQPFDLGRTLDGVEAMLRGRTRAKGLDLVVERSEALPRWVHGDEGKLRQVLINLLGNAVKFTATGRITLRARWRVGIAEFEVADTGHGIDADELEQLFEPFVQTESGRLSKEGTGLGLAISRNFVRMMGGDIRVRSQVGRGSVFSFDVELPEVAEGDERSGRRTVIDLEPGQPEYRVLIVDDQDRNREILVKLLGAVGFSVSEARDGREAVAVWTSWRPDLILMDMRMPVLDGRGATKEIRRLEASNGDGALEFVAGSPVARRRTKIISLTASAFEHERDEILAAGCDDFLTKPFREELLFETLARHLGARFRYATDGRGAASAHAASRRPLEPDRLRGLPSEWLARLNDAVVKGDVEQAIGIVDGLYDHDAALAVELRDLIKAYRFDEIQYLIEQIPQ